MSVTNYGAAAQCDTSAANKLRSVESATEAMFGQLGQAQSVTIDLLAAIEGRLQMVLCADDAAQAVNPTPEHATQLHNTIQGRIETAEWINRRLQSLLDRIGL